MRRVFLFSVLAGKQQQHVTRCLEKQCITLLNVCSSDVAKIFSVSDGSEFTQGQKMPLTVVQPFVTSQRAQYFAGMYFQVVTPARCWSRPLSVNHPPTHEEEPNEHQLKLHSEVHVK